MNEFKILTEKIINFRNVREWQKFHNPKDVAISLNLEASEVLEHFQWKNQEDIAKYVKENKHEISEELADVLNYLLIIAHDLDIDLFQATIDKIDKSESKYPVEKAKGVATKYNKL